MLDLSLRTPYPNLKINSIWIYLILRIRLHHDQQTAHALESAAAYSSYPTMAGKYFILLV